MGQLLGGQTCKLLERAQCSAVYKKKSTCKKTRVLLIEKPLGNVLEPDDIGCFATAVRVSAWVDNTGRENTPPLCIHITVWQRHRQEEFHLMFTSGGHSKLGKNIMSLHYLCGVIQVCARFCCPDCCPMQPPSQEHVHVSAHEIS